MWVDSLKQFLGQSIDGSSLALFRLLFGLVVCLSIIYYSRYLISYYTLFDFYIKYRFFYWVKSPGLWGMRVVIVTLIISLACVSIGLFYHFSIFVALVLYTYIFLQDKAQFNNHYYLMILFLFLFNFVDATQVFAVDNLLFPKKNPSNLIPYWHLLIFQLQLLIVYTYGGLNKITYDWMIRGQPMTIMFNILTPKVKWDWCMSNYCPTEGLAGNISLLFKAKYTGLIFSWFGMLFDIFIIWLMMIPATLPYALPLFVFFHLFNLWFFYIGVFPYLNLCSIVLFLSPEFSKRIIELFQGRG